MIDGGEKGERGRDLGLRFPYVERRAICQLLFFASATCLGMKQIALLDSIEGWRCIRVLAKCILRLSFVHTRMEISKMNHMCQYNPNQQATLSSESLKLLTVTKSPLFHDHASRFRIYQQTLTAAPQDLTFRIERSLSRKKPKCPPKD